jgi:hypothetical protein
MGVILSAEVKMTNLTLVLDFLTCKRSISSSSVFLLLREEESEAEGVLLTMKDGDGVS